MRGSQELRDLAGRRENWLDHINISRGCQWAYQERTAAEVSHTFLLARHERMAICGRRALFPMLNFACEGFVGAQGDGKSKLVMWRRNGRAEAYQTRFFAIIVRSTPTVDNKHQKSANNI